MIPGFRALSSKLAVLAAALALAGVADAQYRPGNAPGLRGPETAASAPKAKAQSSKQAPAAAGSQIPSPALADVASAFPSLPNAAPRYTQDPAPRILGPQPALGGGAQCRQSCAADRYLCRSTEEVEHCDQTWSQCVVACPEISRSDL